ncbi:MAG: fructose PTS transporter subunit IIA [Mycoplasmoidaceae bacterium]|nr:fructose PTS transporter subunit IIA [Mycoplasmoidaceae bacterium]
MKITSLLSEKTIELSAICKNKEDAINQAVGLMAKSGAIENIPAFIEGVFKREKESSTGVGEGIAIPHFKSAIVKKPHLAAMVIKDGVEFESLDGQPVQLLFLIAAPDNKDNVHLDVLARLSSMLMHPDFKDELIKAKDKKEFLSIIDKFEDKRIIEEQAQKEVAAKTQEHTKKHARIVAVTACPTGVAHTYMAQEALEKAAKELGISIKVETQGANPKNLLTDEDIEHAETVIVAADIAVQMERFNGKKLISVSTSRAIKDSKGLIKRSLEKDVPTYTSILNSTKTKMRKISTFGDRLTPWQRIYRHLLSGISHMLPFIVAGGILLAISFIIDGAMGVANTDPLFGQRNLAAMIFHMLGNNLVIALMVPALAGFISYSIAGKQGIVSGFFAGMAATTIVMWAG